jgi:hypothetical protein
MRSSTRSEQCFHRWLLSAPDALALCRLLRYNDFVADGPPVWG